MIILSTKLQSKKSVDKRAKVDFFIRICYDRRYSSAKPLQGECVMDEIRQKVIRHYRDMVQRDPRYMPTRIAELGPGVVAVEDRAGECDIRITEQIYQKSIPIGINLW